MSTQSLKLSESGKETATFSAGAAGAITAPSRHGKWSATTATGTSSWAEIEERGVRAVAPLFVRP
jgi:hypothetical protein